VAATDATFWEPFASRGFTPDGGASWLVPRLVGVARAKDILLLGRQLSREEAARWGLVHVAVEEAALDAYAEDLLSRLANGPTVALGLTKMLVQSSQRPLPDQMADEAFAMELAARSPDFREGMAALAERRAPRFEGR
jgi:2-(1,2-epoxy-1,2-dihydrophenyl)acetyl-CoA isomerase